MSRRTLIVILLSAFAGALRSQPILPPAIDRAEPRSPTRVAAAAQATDRGADSEQASHRELLAFVRDNLVSEPACEAPLRPTLRPQR